MDFTFFRSSIGPCSIKNICNYKKIPCQICPVREKKQKGISQRQGMSIRVRLKDTELHPEAGKPLFRGYLNHSGKLLYDTQAEAVINKTLSEHSLDKLLAEINGAFQFILLQDNILSFTIDHFGGYSLFYKIQGNNIEIFDNPMLMPSQPNSMTARSAVFWPAVLPWVRTPFLHGIKECLPGTLYQFDQNTGKLSTQSWFSYVLSMKRH